MADESVTRAGRARKPLSEEQKEARAAYMAAWYAANREKSLIRMAAWRAENKDRKKEYQEKWLAANRENVRKYERRKYEENKDIRRKAASLYRSENPDYARVCNQKRRARIANAEGFVTRSDIAKIRKAQKDKCGCCKVNLKKKGHIDHIAPLSKGGSNWPNNIQLLCAPCNLSKHDKDPIDFMQERGLLL